MSKYLTTNEILKIRDWRIGREWRPKKANPDTPRCSVCKSVMKEDWRVAAREGMLVSYVCPNSCMRIMNRIDIRS